MIDGSKRKGFLKNIFFGFCVWVCVCVCVSTLAIEKNIDQVLFSLYIQFV